MQLSRGMWRHAPQKSSTFKLPDIKLVKFYASTYASGYIHDEWIPQALRWITRTCVQADPGVVMLVLVGGSLVRLRTISFTDISSSVNGFGKKVPREVVKSHFSYNILQSPYSS